MDHALTSYIQRYGVQQSDLYHVLRALTYFEDAEADPLLPEGLTPQQWMEIKGWFTSHAREALRVRVVDNPPTGS